MKYLRCEPLARKILDEVKAVPDKKGLLILRAGENVATESYVMGKFRDCGYCGIPCEMKSVANREELIDEILTANKDPNYAGIIVQLPLPESFGDPERFTRLVALEKDVDGFRAESSFNPCTPSGIIYVMRHEFGPDLSGLNVLILGRGKLVGKPLAQMLTDANCTVTLAHSKSKNLEWWKGWDVIVVATGVPKTLSLTSCYNTKLIIDVGTNRVDGKLCGDCYGFNEKVISNLTCTPVPGGIGLMTRAMLMKHIADASVHQNKKG